MPVERDVSAETRRHAEMLDRPLSTALAHSPRGDRHRRAHDRSSRRCRPDRPGWQETRTRHPGPAPRGPGREATRRPVVHTPSPRGGRCLGFPCVTERRRRGPRPSSAHFRTRPCPEKVNAVERTAGASVRSISSRSGTPAVRLGDITADEGELSLGMTLQHQAHARAQLTNALLLGDGPRQRAPTRRTTEPGFGDERVGVDRVAQDFDGPAPEMHRAASDVRGKLAHRAEAVGAANGNLFEEQGGCTASAGGASHTRNGDSRGRRTIVPGRPGRQCASASADSATSIAPVASACLMRACIVRIDDHGSCAPDHVQSNAVVIGRLLALAEPVDGRPMASLDQARERGSGRTNRCRRAAAERPGTRSREARRSDGARRHRPDRRLVRGASRCHGSNTSVGLGAVLAQDQSAELRILLHAEDGSSASGAEPNGRARGRDEIGSISRCRRRRSSP